MFNFFSNKYKPTHIFDEEFQLEKNKGYWYKALFKELIKHINKNECVFSIDTIYNLSRSESKIDFNLSGPEILVTSSKLNYSFKIHTTAALSIELKSNYSKEYKKCYCMPDDFLIRTDKNTTKKFTFPMPFDVFKEVNFWREINDPNNIKKTFPTTTPNEDKRQSGEYAQVVFPRFVLHKDLEEKEYKKFENNILWLNLFSDEDKDLDKRILITFKKNKNYENDEFIDCEWNKPLKENELKKYIDLEINNFKFYPIENDNLKKTKVLGKLIY